MPDREPSQPAPDIEEIVSRLQRGDDREANFRLLFDRCFQLLRRFFWQRGCAPDLTQDLIQETFLRVHRALGDFRRESRFETWLLQIAGNVFRQRAVRRSTQKRRAMAVPLEDVEDWERRTAGDPSPDPAVDSLRALLQRERVEALRAALDDLPPQMRRCVILRGFQELRYREIAEVLQISEDAVKVQLSRARKRLRDHLTQLFEKSET